LLKLAASGQILSQPDDALRVPPGPTDQPAIVETQ
jgi:hypothetical protein